MSENQQAPRVSEEFIDNLLETCTVHIGSPPNTTSTFAHIYLSSGFYLASGYSACVDPANFDAEKGLEYALNDAMVQAKKELWKLEGYRLHCALLEERVPPVPEGTTLQ